MGLFWKRKTPQLTRRDVIRLRPVRNQALTWERGEDGNVRIEMLCRRSRLGKTLSIIFFIPREQRRVIELDPIGSFVWERCTGKKDVSKITDDLSDEYNLSRREAEVSLMAYLKTLGEKNLVGFATRKKGLAN